MFAASLKIFRRSLPETIPCRKEAAKNRRRFSKMKKTLSVVLALLMVLAAIPAFAAPVEIDYWSVFTGADGATMQGMVDEFNAS